ncbi:MAG TPA: PDZ domain-containing protein [Thermoanaerobaculia bacterium]|nr:PDZ domain-containing protein [Thermoanaerobaculia bacterium]
MRRLQRLFVFLLIAVSAAAAEPPARMPKAWLGFGYKIHNFDPQSAVPQWLYVERIAVGSPAMQSLRVQDAIVAIDGKPVRFANAASALDFFAAVKPGTVLKLDVIRQGKRIAVSLRAQPIPEGYAAMWQRNQALAEQDDAKAKSKRQ